MGGGTIVVLFSREFMKKYFLSFIFFSFSFFVFCQTVEDPVSNKIEQSEINFSVQQVFSAPEYPVTVGDVYLLTFANSGKSVSYTIPIDSSYKVRVANLGILNVKGMTYVQLKKHVEEIVSKNFPMSAVQFVITMPGTFKVLVEGEVSSVQEKQCWSLSRVSSVIGSSLTEFSSNRNIILISEDGKIRTCDLFKAFRDGDFSQNPYLRPGDKIVINRMDRKVTISGSVERPGTYELLEGENLSKLINYYANGFKIQADLSRVELTKVLGTDSIVGKKIYLTEDEVKSDYKIDCYDSFFIPSYASLKPVVFVEGAIHSTKDNNLETSTRFPVRYEPGTNYAAFVRANSSWFSVTSDIKNAYIIRGNQQIPFDISSYLYDSTTYSDLVLEEYDTLIIPYKQYFVTVSGSVYKPGRYPYIPDRTYDYYVSLAGGVIEEKNTKSSVKITDMTGKKLSKSDFITPESNIFAKCNSFTYYFSKYSPVVTTVLSLITTGITVTTYIRTNQ